MFNNKKGQYPKGHKKKMNKRGQMGETITWVVATIIVVVILAISISIVSLSNSPRAMTIPITSDLFAVKSLAGYLSTGNVYNRLSIDGNFTEETGNLASKIFHGIYDGKVSGIWVGFPEDIVLTRLDNGFFQIFFKLYTKGMRENLIVQAIPISEKILLRENNLEEIILSEDKFIEVYLVY